jgi:hypothetical protein
VYEMIALLAGAAVGVALCGVPSLRRSMALAVPLGVAAGTAVTAISGELEISPAFMLLDAGQSAVAAVLTLVGARVIRQRRSSPNAAEPLDG